MSYAPDGSLQCDMKKDCARSVTHIDEKGFIYCAEHGAQRHHYKRCRKLRAWELALLREGKPVPSYEPITQAEYERREILCRVENMAGIPFNIVVVSKGEHYGLADGILHGKDDPLVEFYDARYTGEGFTPMGQFVSRYYRSTLLDDHPVGGGIDLCGHVPAWQIEAVPFAKVLDALRPPVTSLLWEDDAIQFSRLLAEINAVGLTATQIEGLCASMDLKPKDIFELLTRAEEAFEKLKP